MKQTYIKTVLWKHVVNKISLKAHVSKNLPAIFWLLCLHASLVTQLQVNEPQSSFKNPFEHTVASIYTLASVEMNKRQLLFSFYLERAVDERFIQVDHNALLPIVRYDHLW